MTRGVWIQGARASVGGGDGVGETSPPIGYWMGYRQQVGGTHPTGMHSCIYIKVLRSHCELIFQRPGKTTITQQTWMVLMQLPNLVWGRGCEGSVTPSASNFVFIFIQFSENIMPNDRLSTPSRVGVPI